VRTAVHQHRGLVPVLVPARVHTGGQRHQLHRYVCFNGFGGVCPQFAFLLHMSIGALVAILRTKSFSNSAQTAHTARHVALLLIRAPHALQTSTSAWWTKGASTSATTPPGHSIASATRGTASGRTEGHARQSSARFLSRARSSTRRIALARPRASLARSRAPLATILPAAHSRAPQTGPLLGRIPCVRASVAQACLPPPL
jgi:hypothetical protein